MKMYEEYMDSQLYLLVLCETNRFRKKIGFLEI